MKCSSCFAPCLNNAWKNIFAVALGCILVIAAFGGAEALLRLKDTSVKCLDYSKLLDGNDTPKESLFYKDGGSGAWGHPKAAAYTIVAQQLAKDIPACE